MAICCIALSNISNLPLINLLEDVLEASIISLQNSVLGGHVKRPLLLEGILHATVGESIDGLEEGKEQCQICFHQNFVVEIYKLLVAM